MDKMERAARAYARERAEDDKVPTRIYVKRGATYDVWYVRTASDEAPEGAVVIDTIQPLPEGVVELPRDAVREMLDGIYGEGQY